MAAAIIVLWLLAGWDGRLHWDDPRYLYITTYFDWHSMMTRFLTVDFYPPRLAPRLLHLGILHGSFAVLGPGQWAIFGVRLLYLIMLLAALALSYRIVAHLVSQKEDFYFGYIAGAFAPVVLWLVGRTMPEVPGLLLTAVSLYSLQRFVAVKGRWLWLGASALALGCLVFTRNNLVFAVASYAIAVLLFPPQGYERRRMVAGTAIACLGGIFCFALFMYGSGIALDDYLGGITDAVDETAPWAAVLYFTGLEGGLVFLALPLAFLFGNRRDASLMTAWFLLASLPIYVLLEDIEARYLLPNILPLLGLAGVVAAGWRRRTVAWATGPRWLAAVIVILVLFASGGFAQRFMTHEIEIQVVDRVIQRLRERHRATGFTLLTPNEASDFPYLRVAYPDLSVYNVHEEPAGGDPRRSPDRQRYVHGSYWIASLDELSQLRGPLIYFGFRSSFPVANLRAFIEILPIPSNLRTWVLGQIAQMATRNQLEESWMWEHPSVSFEKFERIQHYHFSEVRLRPAETSGTENRLY